VAVKPHRTDPDAAGAELDAALLGAAGALAADEPAPAGALALPSTDEPQPTNSSPMAEAATHAMPARR
jgi:hypothetical protein